MNLKGKQVNNDYNSISDLSNFLHKDMSEVNNVILDCIFSSQEPLIHQVGTYFFNAGGKRIRPMLTVLISKLFNYQGLSHYYLAAAVELIHAATLLHDDVVDESKMRRSQPTVHLKWNTKTSILVGDFLFSQSFKMMIKSNSMKALKSFSSSFNTIITGEVKQLTQLHSKKIITEDEYFKIIHAKTAELFGTSCEIAAIISNQSEQTCLLVKTFGINLGLIFQIIDDTLDYFGNSNSLGKNIGDDFIESKVTLPVIIAYNCAITQNEKDFWHRVFLNQEKQTEDFKSALNFLYTHNILALIKQKITQLEKQAYDIITKLNITSEYKNHLANFMKYIINRIDLLQN
ncbi:polyprenyl synthetase family protein [Orientia chuto str. Dubai]|uniref:Polyprenyl synthetase family protein n=1 Tax=Orientia chuto str. Dubai TaxID=1359168 RepID=A0A0F3MN65_9RICK|nr:polyprenyl synthetase family protein [Candidatus Orientia mediorientalis]KJV56912.1 polyprenyl synthetase family protein [Orientia chuto str. Dubai]